MSITTALKKLAKNVFNVNTTGNNIDEILDDIANNASSSGGGGSGAGGSDFDKVILFNGEVGPTIPTGLGPEDFVGAYVLNSNSSAVGMITAANYDEYNQTVVWLEYTYLETTIKLYYGVNNGKVSGDEHEVATN